MTRSLYGDLGSISGDEKDDWIGYIESFQQDSGLFVDPACSRSEYWQDERWQHYGPLHLTLHVIGALSACGSIVRKPFRWIEPFKNRDDLLVWLRERNWRDTFHTGNEVQNLTVLLQYTRDYHKDRRAGQAVDLILDFLDRKQVPETGLWGQSRGGPAMVSRQVQGSYHFLLLYFYNQRKISHSEKIIDACLALQNERGGFGVGHETNACEDIDCIDPLVRLSLLTAYRGEEVERALRRALVWVVQNQNRDGGFVFARGSGSECGTSNLVSRPDESSLFPTWFRTLSLAYLTQRISTGAVGAAWNFIDCPGLQFFKKRTV
jgi:hypothetical protein